MDEQMLIAIVDKLALSLKAQGLFQAARDLERMLDERLIQSDLDQIPLFEVS